MGLVAKEHEPRFDQEIGAEQRAIKIYYKWQFFHPDGSNQTGLSNQAPF